MDSRIDSIFAKMIHDVKGFKAHTADTMSLAESRTPLIITQNGEAKAVIQDIESFEQTQETLALLKILTLGNRQVEEGKVQPATQVFGHLRERQQDK
jgi:prevent-host-death family protein